MVVTTTGVAQTHSRPVLEAEARKAGALQARAAELSGAAGHYRAQAARVAIKIEKAAAAAALLTPSGQPGAGRRRLRAAVRKVQVARWLRPQPAGAAATGHRRRRAVCGGRGRAATVGAPGAAGGAWSRDSFFGSIAPPFTGWLLVAANHDWLDVIDHAGRGPSAAEAAELSTVLESVPLFNELGQQQRDRLATRFVAAEARPSEHIFRQGDAGDCFYVLRAGEAAVYIELDGERFLAKRLVAGQGFGEMALLHDEPRRCSV